MNMNTDTDRQRKKRKHTQRSHKSSDVLNFNQAEAINIVGTKQKKQKTDRLPIGNLTKNRLSMKVGMFQFGKRSENFTSKVSEETKARANEDLKRILQLANPPSPPSDCQSNHVIPELNAFRSHPEWNSILPGNKRKKTFSRDCSSKSTDLESVEEEMEFPALPPIEAVADRLSSMFESKMKSVCLGRDYLEESRSELKMILAESKGVPLFLGPTQDLLASSDEAEDEEEEEKEDEDEEEGGDEVVCYTLQNDYSSDQESMRGLKFLRLVEDPSQEPEASDQLGDYQCNSPRTNWQEESFCDQEISREIVQESTFVPNTSGCFCWSSQLLEQQHCSSMQNNQRLPTVNATFNHAGPKQMDFLDYLDRVNMRRKENSCNANAQPAWHSLMPTACTSSLSSRPPLLRSPSPPTYKFYRHRLY